MRGLTLLEIIIVLGITILLAAVAVPLAGNWQFGDSLAASRRQLAQDLRLTRAASAAVYRGQAHGVKFNADGYVLYQGAAYASRQSDYDRQVVLGSGLTLSWQLAGSGPADEIIFSAGLGQPNRSGQLTISNQSGQTAAVTINDWGVVD